MCCYTRGSGGPHIEPQYRQYPQLTKKQQFDAELLSGAMWFWILWHCWHDPDAVMVSGPARKSRTKPCSRLMREESVDECVGVTVHLMIWTTHVNRTQFDQCHAR